MRQNSLEPVRLPGPLAGRLLHYPAGTELPPHYHAGASLSLILEGAQRELVGQRQYECGRYSAVLKGPGVEHANYVGSQPTCGLFVEMSAGAGDALADAAGAPLGAMLHSEAPTRHLVRRIAQELTLGQPGASLIVEGLLFELLGTLIRTGSLPRPRAADPRLRRAIDYLEANFRHRITVAQVALEAGVHPSHLAELFRAGYAVSVGEWVRNRRLEFAREALQVRETPISRIAFQAGFADHSHLTRLFRARFGVSPAEYRRVGVRG